MKTLKLFLTFFLVLLILATFTGQAFGQTSYVIQPGDTLSSIARRFGVSVSAIAAANNIIRIKITYLTVLPIDSHNPST